MARKTVVGREAMGYLSTKPTMIITTLHESGIVNAGVFGAYTNLSPNQIGAVIATTSHTYANIKEQGEFVINIPRADIVNSLGILASNVPASKSELDEAGLTASDPVVINTSGISECAAAVEFSFEKEVSVGHHSLMIGRVEGGWIQEECLDDDGKIDIFKARVIKDFKYPKPLYVLPGEVVEG